MASLPEYDEHSPNDLTRTSIGPEKSLVRSRKRRRSSSAGTASPGGEHRSKSTAQARKVQKVRRVISDGSSEAEEDTTTQVSNTEKTQATASSGISSLQSPPPEIGDSQESLRKRSTISVVVPPLPTESQLEHYIPISSGFEVGSSSQIPTTLEAHSSGEVIKSDYPTPDSEQVQSPFLSEAESPLFFPSSAEPSPKTPTLSSQIRRQSPNSPFAASRRASEILATQITGCGQTGNIQASSPGEVPQSQEASGLTTLSSAQLQVGLTSPIEVTPARLVEGLTPDHRISDSHQPSSQESKKQHSQLSPHPSASPRPTTVQLSQTSSSTSHFKTQISPSQPQKRRLFATLRSEDLEGRSGQKPNATLSRPQSPLRSQVRLESPENVEFARPYSRSSPSVWSPRPKASARPVMATPLYRSSPRTGRAGRATPSPRILSDTTMTEQVPQDRNPPERNAAADPSVSAAGKTPVVAQIREPTQMPLITSTSNPTLQKIEMPHIESSGMQIDPSTSSEISSGSEQSNGKDAPATASLQIQQSIELDDTDKAENSTQDSSILEPLERQENGHVNASSQGLMPNYPILLLREFAIPLHAEGKTQSAYGEIVQAKQKAMSKYLRRGSSSSTPSLSGLVTPKTEANEMVELVGKLDAIVSLLDLGYEGMLTQSSFSGTQLARWAVKASSKFAFIKALIDYIQRHPWWAGDVVIFAKAGQTQQLFEHFLSAYDVNFQQYTNSGEATHTITSAGLLLHLVAGGQKPHIKLRTGKSLIIAFDNSYDPRSEYVLDLRGADGRDEKELPVPVVHLLVVNSSEHIERCLPVNMPSPQRNRLLVQSILQAYRHMGKLLSEVNEITLEYYPLLSGGSIIDDDLMKREQVFQKMPDFHLERMAQQVASQLVGGFDYQAGWSTEPAMPMLELDEVPGLITQQLRLPSPSPMPPSPIGTPSLRKRLLDGDILDTPGGSKRQRMTPVPGASPFDHSEAAQINHLQLALKAAKDETAKEKLARMGAEDARDKARSQLNEWRQSVSQLQKRLEYHREQDHKARTQLKKLGKDTERFNQLRERDANEREALKVQITKLQTEVAHARQALLDTGGSTAALELARAEARTASTALAKAEKDLANAKQQSEYFRTQYQETMATGRQHQADAESLQARVAALEIDASDEKRRLKLVNFDEAANLHLVRIDRLETENKVLEGMVRRLTAENTALKANRGVSTRASSVQPGPPGSPRAREAKSRGGSPVPGLIAPNYSGGSRASALRHERS